MQVMEDTHFEFVMLLEHNMSRMLTALLAS